MLYLRSGPRDTHLGLFDYELSTRTERALAQPAAEEHLSVEEKARRERARMTLTGITDFALSDDGSRVLVSQGDKLATIDMPGGAQKPVPGEGWIAPELAPDGSVRERVVSPEDFGISCRSDWASVAEAPACVALISPLSAISSSSMPTKSIVSSSRSASVWL